MGCTRASRTSLLFAGPLSGINPHILAGYCCIHTRLTRKVRVFSVIAVYAGTGMGGGEETES